jgi:hypothetical protein
MQFTDKATVVALGFDVVLVLKVEIVVIVDCGESAAFRSVDSRYQTGFTSTPAGRYEESQQTKSSV